MESTSAALLTTSVENLVFFQKCDSLIFQYSRAFEKLQDNVSFFVQALIF